MGAAQIRRDRPARAQDERSNRLHVADPTAAQPLDQDDENLLDKVLRSGCVTQVPEAIEPDPRCETPIKLRLLFLRGLVVQGDEKVASFSGTIRKSNPK